MVKYTPDNIQKLEPNQIICFGSNEAGRHGKGLAKLALQKFGARYGVGRGLQGQSYALPTKDFEIQSLPLFEIKKNIEQFLDFARENPQYEFLATLIGCGLANFTPGQIGPMFAKFNIPTNVVLPIEFAQFVSGYMDRDRK